MKCRGKDVFVLTDNTNPCCFLFAGEPLHGYRVCIQAILQDKPKIATQNLPEVSECVLKFCLWLRAFWWDKLVTSAGSFCSRGTFPSADSHMYILICCIYHVLVFLSSIWSCCGQFRIVQWSVWPSCGLWVRLDFLTSVRDYEVIEFLHIFAQLKTCALVQNDCRSILSPYCDPITSGQLSVELFPPAFIVTTCDWISLVDLSPWESTDSAHLDSFWGEVVAWEKCWTEVPFNGAACYTWTSVEIMGCLDLNGSIKMPL